ncbi:hypothetical protein [Paenibacillus aestuarii]|uniref:Uncharacterized protein n=1 Tax=Paenibacillus aestuarii TaxID=516965 RepID=A0ABW0K1G7_9BACL|nr:hypothetical protein [Paenibacillus aestuarii]
MKGNKRIRPTTLLIIGAIVLWGVVALWNEVQRTETGLPAVQPTTAVHMKSGPSANSNQIAINPGGDSANLGSP